jgi:voltage-gated potassium channel
MIFFRGTSRLSNLLRKASRASTENITRMQRSTRRLLLLAASLPALVFVIALGYMEAMSHIEGTSRNFWSSLEWAAETLTTTGYGADSHWNHALMVLFVVVVQFLGLFLVFLIFPVYLIPFFEERFEARLPADLPARTGASYVLIYGYGPAVSTLMEELARHNRRLLVLEENAETARELQERRVPVVRMRRALEEMDFKTIGHASAIIANGSDHSNAALLLIARDNGFRGPFFALMDDPLHRQPLTAWGATAVFTPAHVLAAALAARASRRIRPTVQGVQQLGKHLGVAELRIHKDSPLAGQTLAGAMMRERHGVVVLGQWSNGEFIPRPLVRTPLQVGDIIVAAGPEPALEQLDSLAIPLTRLGPIVIAGYGEVGRKVREMLADAGEQTIVIDRQAADGVDVVGNALERATLESAGVRDASTVVVALSKDSEALFAATMVRQFSPDTLLVVRANQSQTVHRLHRVGADFALATGQVAGSLLARHLLGEEYMDLEQGLKLARVLPSRLAGGHPLDSPELRGRACQVVAIERGKELIVEFPPDFRIGEQDAVYLAGAPEAVDSFTSAH